jgi:hypothetical protein
MSDKLTEFRDALRAALQDTDPENQIWADTELDQHLIRALFDINSVRPREQKTTLTTTVASKDLDISSLADRLDVVKVEYRVGQDPQEFRNFTTWADVLTMDIDSLPSAAESVYIYWTSPHTLTTATSTLPAALVNLLLMGGEAFAALAWINKGRSQIVESITKLTSVDTALGLIAARVAQAVTDLAAARLGIGLKATEANTAIEAMQARITQAVADIASGRALVNSLTRGSNAETDYLRVAATELNTATEYLSKARGYLAEDQPAQEKANLASHELNAAGGYINEARSRLTGISSKLNIAAMVRQYQADAMQKLALFKTELKQHEPILIVPNYSKD